MLTPAVEAAIAAHPHGNILQTPRWGALKARFGWRYDEVRCGSAWALVLYKPLLRGLVTLAYVPRGPLVGSAAELAALCAQIERAARRRRALAVWIEPPLWEISEAQVRALGFRPGARTIQPPNTIVVDIAPDEATVLERMKQKTRYNIRLAERKGVTTRLGGPDDADAFYALMRETGARDGFEVHSPAYYQAVFELFLPPQEPPLAQAALWLAEVEGAAVAALVVFALGKTAWYFYGASSMRHREKMPAYAAQWAAIRWAKSRGCTSYDLWGIPDADADTLEAQFEERNDGLWGVYRFKRGFGGQVVRYTGLWEKPLSPLYAVALRVQAALER